ncbi:hypothetical protein GGX14DRAFT_607387 [Mycena pura]|uniref:F-box domain-containing protein n=1 Tax=Mycena pura TaxID=153505 RepID=A0AAD6XZK6_9AGAR|nr:hypothetical protein GGX14DRAFT_607387 [Mycena pura]
MNPHTIAARDRELFDKDQIRRQTLRALLATTLDRYCDIEKELVQQDVVLRLDPEAYRTYSRLLAKFRENCEKMVREYEALEPISLTAFAASPVRRCPDDVLIKIISTLVASVRATRDLGRRDLSHIGAGPAMVFSQVCSNFRALALSQPNFWSNFSCPFYPNESMAQLLEVYLQRSGTAPLTIVLKFDQVPGNHGYAVRQEQLFARLDAHCARIRSLTLFGDLPAAATPSFERLGEKLLGLEVLSLLIHPEDYPIPGLQTLLKLHKFDMPAEILRYHTLPFSQVTTAHLWNVDDVTVILSLPNLHTLSLIFTIEIPRVRHDAVLPNLTALYLEGGSLDEILDCLTTPALTTLKVSNMGVARERLEILWAFLVRSQCPLQSIVFSECAVTTEYFLRIFQHFSGLRSLVVEDTESEVIRDEVLAALTREPAHTGAALLPELSHLRFVRQWGFSTDALFRMLASRMVRRGSDVQGVQGPAAATVPHSNGIIPPALLQQVDIVFLAGVVPEEDLPRFETLEGLSASRSYPVSPFASVDFEAYRAATSSIRWPL